MTRRSATLAVRLGGLRPGLLYVGPAVMAALVIAVGVLLAREACRGVSAIAGGTAVIALLAFATPAMSVFLVGRGFHISTVLYTLLAFARSGGDASAGMGPGGGPARGGMLGDLLLVAYRESPLLLSGLLAALRQQGGRAQSRTSRLRSPVW